MCRHHGLNRRTFLTLLPGMALSTALAGCGGPATGPAEVKWGRETCDYCGMIIDDPHFAGQLRGKDGKVHKFDDFGDAILWVAKQGWVEESVLEFWVGGVESGTWLDGRKAFYTEGHHTPMAHGFGAVDGGRPGAVDYQTMRSRVLARGSTSRCEPTSIAPEQTNTRDG